MDFLRDEILRTVSPADVAKLIMFIYDADIMGDGTFARKATGCKYKVLMGRDWASGTQATISSKYSDDCPVDHVVNSAFDAARIFRPIETFWEDSFEKDGTDYYELPVSDLLWCLKSVQSIRMGQRDRRNWEEVLGASQRLTIDRDMTMEVDWMQVLREIES